MKEKASLANPMLLAPILGVAFGLIAHGLFSSELKDCLFTWMLNPIGSIFLRGMKMLVAPIVLCSVIYSTASIGTIKGLGRIGGKIVLYYLSTTILGVTIAMIFAGIINPGLGMNPALPDTYKAAAAPSFADALINAMPLNPIEALANGNLLQIIVFAVIFGVGLSLVGESTAPLLSIISQINDIMDRILHLLMRAAPCGVFALTAVVFMSEGLGVLLPLVKYTVTVLILLLLQVLVVYSAALKFIGRVDPLPFFRKFWSVMILAFSTYSSYAAIPASMDICRRKLGTSESITRLTIPFGAAVHLNGTAIMQGAAALFIAQVYGLHLSVLQLGLIMLTATASSIATTGVPGAGIMLLAMLLKQAGIPLEGIALVLSADRILYMFQAVVNVTGNAIGTVLISKSEEELNLEVYNS